MQDKELEREQKPSEDDVEGQSLLLDTDYPRHGQRRPFKAEHDVRSHRQVKEARPNRPDRG